MAYELLTQRRKLKRGSNKSGELGKFFGKKISGGDAY